jgi:hypothetical protein
MKWGVRKQRQLDAANRVASGNASTLQKVRFGASATTKELVTSGGSLKKIARARANTLEAQKKRIEQGKATTLDMLDRFGNTPILDLVRGR